MCNKYFKKILSIGFVFVSVLSHPLFAYDVVMPAENISITASVLSSSSNDNGGGGVPTSVNFSGFAYPHAVVHVWKDGISKTTTTALSDGSFYISLSEVYSPNAMYTLYAIDKNYRQSLLLNYPVVVKSGYITTISGIRFPPTITADKTEVKRNGNIIFSGYALPDTKLELVLNGLEQRTLNLESHSDGTYKFDLNLYNLPKGNYNVYIHYKNDKRISKVVKFTIGDINVSSTELLNNIPGDCNADQIINLIDFSVAAYWYGKPNPPRCIDPNKDNIIDLVDFSILAFYWNG